GGAAFTLTATGTNFVGTSVVQVDGAARTTTFGSATVLTALIPAGDIASGGTRAVTVFTPTPGGGTSTALTLTVVGPGVAVNSTTVAPGGTMTFTLTNGPGNQADWIALYCPPGSASYLDWKYMTNTQALPPSPLTGA